MNNNSWICRHRHRTISAIAIAAIVAHATVVRGTTTNFFCPKGLHATRSAGCRRWCRLISHQFSHVVVGSSADYYYYYYYYVDGDNDSDATTLDGEDSCDKIDHCDKNDDDGCNSLVDLLTDDDSDANNNNNDKPTSPISPATKTLGQLSQFSSSEGGAELCIYWQMPLRPYTGLPLQIILFQLIMENLRRADGAMGATICYCQVVPEQ